MAGPMAPPPPPMQAKRARSEKDEAKADSPGMREQGRAAPPPPPQEADDKPSFVERVAKAVTGLFRSADMPEPAPVLQEEQADEGTAGASIVLAGRILKRDDHGAVLEVELEAETDLAFEGADVEVTLEDGSQVAGRVKIDASTREGRHPAGVRIRITVQLDGPSASPIASVRVRLPSSGADGRTVIILATQG